MSERYWITGVQLAMLVSSSNVEEATKEIMDKQFICNCYTEEEQDAFRKACMV